MTTVTLPAYTVGKNACEQFAKICQPLGKRLFLIGGDKAFAAALPKLEASLAGSSSIIVEKRPFGKDCTFSRIAELAAEAKEAKADLIVGIGGGKALDTAKGVARQTGLSVVTVPTIAATCAAITALSVVYRENGGFERFYFYETPPAHAILDTELIAAAPPRYLRAGMGDTLGKHYESRLSARGDRLEHSSALGIALAGLCLEPLLTYGSDALADCEAHRATDALEQAVLANIVSTGLVSILVQDCYNCAMAHSLFYGLALLPGFEEKNLHGDAVAYGVLVQLMIDGRPGEAKRLRGFLRSIGCPVLLAEMGVENDRKLLAPVLAEAVAGPDMEHLPYPVSEEMFWQGIQAVEQL